MIGPLPSAPRAVSQEQTGPVLAASPYAMPLAYEQAGRSEGSGGTLQSGRGGRGSGRRPRRRAGRLCSWFCGLCWRLFDLVHMLLAPLKGGGVGRNRRALILWWKPSAVALGRPVRISPTPRGGGQGPRRTPGFPLGKECPPRGRLPSQRLWAPCHTLPWSSKGLWGPDQKVRAARRSVR